MPLLSIAFSAPAPSPPPLRIGVSLGLTGSYANIARLQQRAYQLWETHVNQAGGILGRKVEVIIRDDRSDPAVSKKIYQTFIRTDKLEFVFAPYSSPIAAAIAPIVDRYGYPTLFSGSSADDIWKQGYTNVFGVVPPAGRYAVGFLAVLSEIGIRRLAIVSVDDLFSLSASAGAQKWAPLYGVRVTQYVVEPKNQPNLARAAAAARRSGAQVLFLAGHYEEAVSMRRVLKRLDWTPVYYATIGPALHKYHDELGADAHATLSSSRWEPREDLRYPGSTEFLRQFLAAYGEPPSYHAAHAYAAGQVLEHAIRKVGSIDRAAIRQQLATLDVGTIVGRYAVDQTGQQLKGWPMIIQWQGDKREIVWPPELRTATPILSAAPRKAVSADRGQE